MTTRPRGERGSNAVLTREAAGGVAAGEKPAARAADRNGFVRRWTIVPGNRSWSARPQIQIAAACANGAVI
jgi:hypothetical protein